jgi:hypothetical protein
VLDCDAASATYGKLVGWAELPTGGNELHHFGWNACSSALCHQGHGACSLDDAGGDRPAAGQRGGVIQAGPPGCQVAGASISTFAFAAPGAR